MLPRSMKGELRFFGVSSLSHSFARALPYSAYLWKGGIEIFLVGSRPTLGEYF